MLTLARIRRATVVIAAALALVGGVTVAAAGSAAASPQNCRSVLGNGATFSRNGTSIGVFYIAWDSCSKLVYGEVRFDNTAKATGWDWDSQVYVNHDGDNSQGTTIDGGGVQFWHSPLVSIYSAPSSDRAYYAGFELWNNGSEACWGWAGWDFSGHQLETTYARCDIP